MKRFFQYLCICLLSILCVLFVGCGANGAQNYSSAPETGNDVGDKTQSVTISNPLNRKIVYTVRLQADCEDVKDAKGKLDEKCTTLGGYIEYNSEDYAEGKCTYAYITYRVPTDKLNDFIAQAEKSGEITSKSVDTTDITTAYVNASAQKTALETRKAALQALLNDTAVSASDRITIINEISKVDTELQSIELLLTQYDSMVDYSTVTVTLHDAEWYADEPPVFAIVSTCVLFAGAIFCAVFFPLYYKKKYNKENK